MTDIKWSDFKERERERERKLNKKWLHRERRERKDLGDGTQQVNPFPHIVRKISGYIPNPASMTYPRLPSDFQLMMN